MEDFNKNTDRETDEFQTSANCLAFSALEVLGK